MKLHLPKMLTAALLAAFSAISAQAEVAFSGTILTWNGDMYNKNDAAYGQYYKTTFDGTSFNVDETQVVQPTDNGHWPDVSAVIANKDLQPQNTLRFDSNYGQTRKTIPYTFNPFSVGGIIVDTGATGFVIQSSGSYDRHFWLGSSDATPGYSLIRENFSLNKTSGNGTLHLRGTQTFDVASGRTFTLKSNNAIDFAGALTVTGGGVVDFAQGTTTMAANSSVTVDGATLKYTSSVTMGAGTSVTVNSGSTLTYGASLTMAGNSTLSNAGALTLNGTVKLGSAGIANTGTVTLGNNIVFDLSQMQAVENKYTLFSGNGLDLSKLTKSNITGIDTAGKTFTFGTDGTISFTQSVDNVWSAGEGFWNYTEENWSNGKFSAGEIAVFNSDYSAAYVNENVEAGGIKATGAITSISADFQTPGTLTAGNVQVAGGAQLMTAISIGGVEEFTVAEGGIWTIGANQVLGSGSNSGTLSVSNGYTLTLTDAATAASLLQSVTGSGNITLATDTLFAGSSSQDTPATTHATGALIVGEGKTLQIGTTNTGAYAHTYVNMTSFNEIRLDGSTLWIHNDEFDLNNVTVTEKGGTVTIFDTAGQNNNTLNLKGTTQLNGTLTFNGSWKQKFTIDKLAGTGTLKLDGVGHDKQIVNIGGGEIGRIYVTSGSVTSNILGDLTTTGDLTLKAGTTNVSSKVTVKGSLDLSDGGNSTATLNIAGTGEVDVTGSIWSRSAATLLIAEGGKLVNGYVSMVGLEGGGSVATTGGNTQYSLENTTYTLTNLLVNVTGDVANFANNLAGSDINVGTHAVTLTNGNNVVRNATVAEGGSLSIAGGSLVGTIESAGSVAMSGTIDITYMDYEDATIYTGGTDPSGLNGFGQYAGKYSLAKGSGDLDFSQATIMYADEDITKDVDQDGTYLVVDEEVDYTTFWVNAGTESVSTAKTAGQGQADLEMIEVASGATLTVDQNTNLSLITAGTGAKLDIANGKVLTVDNSATTTATIAGSGTYALKEGSKDLAGATLDDGWTGTVVVSGVSGAAGNNLDLNALGREGSTVKIDGYSGYFLKDPTPFAAELELGEGGLTLNNGFSNNSLGVSTEYIFNGGVSGAGNMNFSKDSGDVHQHLYFTGNVRDWTGSLNVTGGFTVYAYFNGQEVNADINHEGGTLNVYADGTTFNKGVTASSLTVQNGVTIKNMGDDQVDMGSVSIDANSTLGLYKGDTTEAAEEATLLIDEGNALTVAALGTLNADLVLNAGSALDVSGTLGEGLIMGSDVSMYTGDLLAVTPEGGSQTTEEAAVDAYLRAFFAEGSHEYYTLFTGVDTFSINDIVQDQDLTFTDWLHFSLDASRVFDNLIENTYAVVYHMGANAGEGTVALKMIPEPTTGTLSLLALMALAARRRRH